MPSATPHVLLTVLPPHHRPQVDAAAAMIQRLLQPLDEEMNEHKKLQLRELATINGTLKDEEFCFVCGETGEAAVPCSEAAALVQ